MLTIISKRSINKIICSLKVKFSQMKDNNPNFNEKQVLYSEMQFMFCENVKNMYIKKYQQISNNVENYKVTLSKLQEQIQQMNKIKNKLNNPIRQIFYRLFNVKEQQQNTITRLKNLIQKNKQVASNMWKQSLEQSSYIANYNHKIFGKDLITLNSDLLKYQKYQDVSIKVRQGIQLTSKMLNMILFKYGFSTFKPVLKEKFNEEFHEQVDRIRTHQPKNTIVKVVEDGWMHSDQVLILAKVIVSQ